MQTHHERGIALVLALFLMTALSVLGASLMFLSQTETFASMNYRMMSQARYAAEAGVHRTASYLVGGQYPVPSVADLPNYDRNTSPVVCLSGCPNSDPNNPNHYVILSASPTYQSNYPVAAVATAFDSVGAGVVHTAAGTNQDVSLTYKSYATLISMQWFTGYGGTQSIVQTWEITVDGSLTNTPKATVEVSATVETPKVPANQFGAFATSDQCNAIHFQGNVSTDSYDSSVAPPGTLPCVGCSTEKSGGDVGSNGNIFVGGSVDVGGNIYTPRQGVGACTAGAVTGLTGTISGQLVPLPGALVFPPPVFPIQPPTTTVTLDAAALGTAAAQATTCTALGLTLGTNCSVTGSTLTVDGHGLSVVMPNVVVGSGITLLFVGANTPGQTIDINSINGSVGAAVETSVNNVAGNDQSVILRIAGKKADGTDMMGTNPVTDPSPFDLSAMTWKQNATAKSYDASSLQIVYGGPAEISMTGGNAQSAATIYAPNATFHMQGTQDFYGSILAKTVDNSGTPRIHYDRRLQRDFDMAGHPMMGTFSWKKSS
jgi:Tfp pilus assembly protein PilX